MAGEELFEIGAGGGIRTLDPLIVNQTVGRSNRRSWLEF